MKTDQFQRSYADFGLRRSVRQVRHALESRGRAESDMQQLFESMAVPEMRIEQRLGEAIENKRILEIGPGQGMERALYFARKNDVVAMDRDIVPTGLDPALYWKMARENGLGRVVKTAGRHVLIGRAMQASWAKLVGEDEANPPTLRYGDIESDPLEPEAFDVVTTWSVFEHLGQPRRALENVIAALKPGGVLHISIHVFTAHDGHHDIRAFTGEGDDLPLWGHLRPTTTHQINPSSYLTEGRIHQGRELFEELTPGADEYLDEYEVRERFGPLLTPELRDELAEYSDDELFTVNAVYVWRKPSD
ncbi:MAG: methyltransferase domain-containing protein [Acidimicrobiales bacterium]